MNHTLRNRIAICDDLYFHGLGNHLKNMINPRKLDIGKSERLYYYWIRNQRPIGIGDLKNIVGRNKIYNLIKSVFYISAYASPHIIKFSSLNEKDLAYLCGYHLGDGYIGKDLLTIYYMDSEEQLLRISKIYKKLFGIGLKITKDPKKNAFGGTITSKALASILHYCLEMYAGKKGILFIPSWVKGSLKREFIIGFLDAEFGVNRKKYQFSGSSIDKEFMLLLQNELRKYGLNLKFYGPYSSGQDPNPRWFLKTSKVSTMYWLKQNDFIRHPNHLKILINHLLRRAPVV